MITVFFEGLASSFSGYPFRLFVYRSYNADREARMIDAMKVARDVRVAYSSSIPEVNVSLTLTETAHGRDREIA
ncbi:hypothetical protein ACQKH5_14165 [Hyphomonas sp. NPDC076900]|uniref:hypothetical protein n=1 Tax=unclassified Hyphomonas TaxID=2630699 RepID=UPI003CFD8B93